MLMDGGILTPILSLRAFLPFHFDKLSVKPGKNAREKGSGVRIPRTIRSSYQTQLPFVSSATSGPMPDPTTAFDSNLAITVLPP